MFIFHPMSKYLLIIMIIIIIIIIIITVNIPNMPIWNNHTYFNLWPSKIWFHKYNNNNNLINNKNNNNNLIYIAKFAIRFRGAKSIVI